MRTRLFGLVAGVLGVALTAALAVPATASTSPAHRYPVPWTFAVAPVAALRPYASPPGANHWNCRPSAAHPEPVVLVHGLFGNRDDNWQTFAPLLADQGYCVFALTYGTDPGAPFPADQAGGLAPIEDSAAQLATFVHRVLASTGAHRVGILGHSEGTVVPDYYVKFLGGAAEVDKYVSLAPLWHGTDAAGLATLDQLGAAFGLAPVVNTVLDQGCASCQEMLAGSPFIAKLRAGGAAVPGVTYTNIVTQHDELVVPYTSGIEPAPNVTNIVLQHQCGLDHADHLAIAADPVAAADVLNALDPAHPRPVPCVFVPPVVG